LADVSHADLQGWFARQRDYYHGMLQRFTGSMQALLPGVIVSRPQASIYSVVDVRNVVPAGFDALDFVLFCARTGAVDVDGDRWTLLTAPLAEFYDCPPGQPNPGRTQMRVAYVEPPDQMERVPRLMADLLRQYLDHGG